MGWGGPAVADLRARMGNAFYTEIIDAYTFDFIGRNIDEDTFICDAPFHQLAEQQEELFSPLDPHDPHQVGQSSIDPALYNELREWANHVHDMALAGGLPRRLR